MVIGIDIRNIGKKRTGDETVFFQLVKHLALIDNENAYRLFIDNRTEEDLAVIRERLGLVGRDNFSFVSLQTGGKFDWNFRALPKALRQYPVDVYHTQYILPLFVPRLTKLVTHIHDISFRAYPQFIRWQDRFFLNALIPWSVRRADVVVAVSEFTKREICQAYGVSGDKVSVIYNALGDDFASVAEGDVLVAVKKKYALSEKFVLYVGTLQPRKNIPTLLRAYAADRERLEGIGLVIAGNLSGHNVDPEIGRMVRDMALEGKVVFPGYIDQDDLPALMRAAHLFVYPSLYEGFGIPLLEAMSQGVPVLASDIPCLREVAGDAAFFAPPKDVARFAEVLYNACIDSERRRQIVVAAAQRIQAFSWKRSAENLLVLYKRLY